MSENANNDKNDLLNALNSVSEVNVGDVVTGEVLAKDDDQQLIVGIEDTGVEGVVPQRELSSSQNFDDIKQGDKLQLVVTSRIGSDKEGGSFLLSSRRLEASPLTIGIPLNWLKSQRTMKQLPQKFPKQLRVAQQLMPAFAVLSPHQ